MQPRIDALESLLALLPEAYVARLRELNHEDSLLEVVLDLGRKPVARYVDHDAVIVEREVTPDDLALVTRNLKFGDDNRAGLSGTLHRISALRNRSGEIIGLSCRIGRSVPGASEMLESYVRSGKSILVVGRPGRGKTTLLRDIARVLADGERKRVMIVDTSNEIAGDGDVPHPAIGSARRLQVRSTAQQHAAMIEAVENHMPEVLVIDEIGTTEEAAAARTIAERGVQLIATAHGSSLRSVLLNPTLADLVGGIESVTLGDEEAHRRGSQKTVLERRSPPTFEICVEIEDWQCFVIHADVAATVDQLLAGESATAERRERRGDHSVGRSTVNTEALTEEHIERRGGTTGASLTVMTAPLTVYAPEVAPRRMARAIETISANVQLVGRLADASTVITLRSGRRKVRAIAEQAAARQIPVITMRGDSLRECQNALRSALRQAA